MATGCARQEASAIGRVTALASAERDASRLYEAAAPDFQPSDRFEGIGCRAVRGRPGLATVVAGKGEPMAIVEDRPATGARTFDSVSPATGEVVGSFPLDGPERVAAAVARARAAAAGTA
jgi:hypothetical protein